MRAFHLSQVDRQGRAELGAARGSHGVADSPNPTAGASLLARRAGDGAAGERPRRLRKGQNLSHFVAGGRCGLGSRRAWLVAASSRVPAHSHTGFS